jgi:hypothetical protein
VAYATQPRHFKRKLRGRDIDPHAANHDRHKLLHTEPQTVIVNTLHQLPSKTAANTVCLANGLDQ